MRRFLRSFAHAWRGLRITAQNEPNFQIELALGALALLIAWFVRVAVWPVIIVVTMVLIVETLNSAVERIVDHVSPDIHPAAKNIKDISAGAVLIASLGALAFAIAYLVPPLLAKLGVH